MVVLCVVPIRTPALCRVSGHGVSSTLTGATLRLVEGIVRVKARGPVPVKGMAAPVEVYDLTGASPIRRPLQAAVARGLRVCGRW